MKKSIHKKLLPELSLHIRQRDIRMPGSKQECKAFDWTLRNELGEKWCLEVTQKI